MDTIGSEVDRQLGRFDGRGAMPRIVGAWTTAVGQEVARNAWPARTTRDGTLLVHTSSSVWAFELGHLAPTILDRLTEVLGEHAPRALRFLPGHVPEPLPRPSARMGQGALRPAAESTAEARLLTASIEDPELRERVLRAAALGLERSRSGRSF